MRIISDILYFAKIESGKLDMEQIFFTLYEVTSRMKKLLGNIAEKKNIALNIRNGEFTNTPTLGDSVH